jgi:hypothetical protein
MKILLLIPGLVLAASGLGVAADEVNTSPVAVGFRRVFPEVEIRRPIVVTHANDGSDQ